MKENLGQLVTESINKDTTNIDKVSTIEMIEMINNEDKKVAYAVEKCKEDIARAVDLVYERLSKGGRLIYVGAGTSGRLGIVDASECPPTFGVDFEMIQGVMAGGYGAIFKAVEGAEDSEELGKKDLKERNLTSNDVVCGIAASGRTPYVIGAMRYGKEVGAGVICVTMNPDSIMAKEAEVPISVVVGPEVIMGSTRMKAGTAQKMVLNMITTGTMIRLGKVYGNLMVDVQTTNEKLVDRAKRIISLATGVDKAEASKYLNITDNNVKLAIFMIKTGLNVKDAKVVLDQNNGYIQKALDSLKK